MASDTASTATPRDDRDRAFGPGPRRLLVAAVAAVVAAAIVVTIVLLSGGSGGHRSHRHAVASLRYGQIPSWLPKPTPPPNQVVTATAAHPVPAAIEGNTVHAELPHGSADVTAVGPAIPHWVQSELQSGSFNESSTAPSTFTVTFASPHGVVPLRAKAFSIITDQGQIVYPAVTAPHGRPLPARVAPGKPVTLTVKVGLNEGDGALRWAPDGPKVLVAWLYHLELD